MFLLFDELKLSENEELDYRICSLGSKGEGQTERKKKRERDERECQRVDNLRRQAADEILVVLVDVVLGEEEKDNSQG